MGFKIINAVRINKMKKDKEDYPERIMNSDNYWFSYTAEDIMEPWKKMIKP